MVWWLRLLASTAQGTNSIPGQGTKILPATQCGQKKIAFYVYPEQNEGCHIMVYLKNFFVKNNAHILFIHLEHIAP